MVSTFAIIVGIIGCIIGSSHARLIKEQIEAYKKILGTEIVTADGLIKLIQLHDNDAVCIDACRRYVEELVGPAGIDFHLLEAMVEKLYGGMISLDPYDSQEVHLALTDSLTEMKVMWVSMKELTDPFVEYTLSSSDWTPETTMTTKAISYTYSVPHNWYPVFGGVIYETNMVGLLQGKSHYKYRVGGYDSANATIRRSQDFEFYSAPVPSADQKTVFGMLGDQGTFMLLGFATSKKLIELQDQLGVDVVHYAGDLCYAGLSGDLTPFNHVDEDDEFGHIWDLWGIQNEPIAATRPFMTTPGNHESFYNWTAFNNRYHMPFEKSQGNGNFWWSYDYGNVHITSISTEDCFDTSCPQMTWMEKDLQAAVANRAAVPWIVVSLHRPIYCSDESQYDSHSPGGKYQRALESMLLQYDVDLVLQGHMHAYERVHPVINGTVTVTPRKVRSESNGLIDLYQAEGKGPVYVVQGNTGAMQVEHWINPKPDWSAVRFANGFIPPKDHDGHGPKPSGNFSYSDTFGVGIATFYNSTHLHYSNYPVTGTLGVDEFWVVKRV